MGSSNYLTRIAQVDALKLDNEIVEIFKRQVYEVLKYLPVSKKPNSNLNTPKLIPYLFQVSLSAKYDPEITLLLRLFMFNHSLIKHEATFGQQLVAIKYEQLSNNQKLLYGLLTHGLNYAKDRVHFLKSDIIPNWNLVKIIDRLEGLIALVSLWNFLRFLKSGEKPLLIDRVLNLKQISTRQRYINNNMDSFVTREMLWHTFMVSAPIYYLQTLSHRLSALFRRLCLWGFIR